MRVLHVHTAALLSVLLLLSACGGGGDGGDRHVTSPAAAHTVILGIDALDWHVLGPVMDAGRAPNLAALRDASVSGIHLSFVPLEKSPLIWASMASGLEPQQHGVGGFVTGRGDGYEALATAADWKAPALWDIAGAAGRRSCVIGWWVTHPARDIPGVMVSDHVTYTAAGSRHRDGLVRPADLTDAIAALTVEAADVPVELLAELCPGADPAWLADPANERLRDLRHAIAGDLTYLATARLLAEREAFDLFAVYFRGFDLVCHNYWQYWNPGDGRPASAEDQQLLGGVVPGYLTLVDRWVGELLPLLPAGANVVVASDHGFYGPRKDRSGTLRKGVSEHRPEGVIMVRSPMYTAGSTCDRDFVLNFAPTVLALMGLPASQDMPGRVLRDGLTDAGAAYVAHLETHRIASYASLAPAPPADVASDPALDEAVRKQLRSLGYVD